MSSEDTSKLTAGRLQHAGDPCRRSIQHAKQLAAELVERRHRREGFYPPGVEPLTAEGTPDDRQLFVLVGELDGDFRRCHRIPRIGYRRRAGEHRRKLLELRACKGET